MDEREKNRSPPDVPAPYVVDLARVWAATIPVVAAPASNGAMFRIFWSHWSGVGFRDLELGAGKHLIIGRHSKCDIELFDPALSLRHLLVVPEGAPTAPAIRLVELRAALPMYTSLGRAERSLTFEGPFAIRLGHYLLGGFRVGPGAPPVPTELPLLEERESDPPVSASARPEHGPERPTFVTTMPPPVTLADISNAGHAGVVQLVGRREGMTARVRLSERDLRAGVVIGRTEKGVDQDLTQVMNRQVSRVHAVLMMDDHAKIWLYDVTSTRGTTVSGTRIRSAPLAELTPFVARAPAQLASQIEVALEELE